MPQYPADVAIRADAEVGRLLRNVVNALPAGWSLKVAFTTPWWFAVAEDKTGRAIHDRSTDLALALEGLVYRLTQATCDHDWRTYDEGEHCVNCGAER
jgi:hypothetical protein